MRHSGILLSISSLPSDYGIGTLGKAAFDFVDFLAAAGQGLWQLLPVGPTGFGDSPYQSCSAFAGNPYFIDLGLLVQDGLLTAEEIGENWGEEATRVDYALLLEKRYSVLALAVERQDKTLPAYTRFCKANSFWLDDYALFMALKEANGQADFQEWPEGIRTRKPEELQKAKAELAGRIEFWHCLQFFFAKQWKPLKAYANKKGVRLIGDIPIYISPDSSDFWANPELFQTGEDGRPSAVAGVPPDAFSSDGQLWGNPLYNWRNHEQNGYKWWIRRLKHNMGLYDICRIDHFRGFADYYSVSAGAENARSGKWVKGPGRKFIKAINTALPDAQIIAEDLGFLTPSVYSLLKYSKYPGMKVLQFAFDSKGESDYLPHNYTQHAVVYTGTHDNTTTADWALTSKPKDVAFARRYLGIKKKNNLTNAMIRAALRSVADTAVIPMQDWLGLGGKARMNTPSTLGGTNWQWRVQSLQLTPKLAAKIHEQTKLSGRLSAFSKSKRIITKPVSK